MGVLSNKRDQDFFGFPSMYLDRNQPLNIIEVKFEKVLEPFCFDTILYNDSAKQLLSKRNNE